jgi:KDO2-lipid IV(A) lauroyltransferase
MGVWVPFLGKPAYTMTLAARLAQEADTVLLMWGERLPWGRGFRIHVCRPPGPLPTDLTEAAACVNNWVAQLIKACPEQYLWGYDRFKGPKLTGGEKA